LLQKPHAGPEQSTQPRLLGTIQHLNNCLHIIAASAGPDELELSTEPNGQEPSTELSGHELAAYFKAISTYMKDLVYIPEITWTANRGD
jgi:hypothetical protein